MTNAMPWEQERGQSHADLVDQLTGMGLNWDTADHAALKMATPSKRMPWEPLPPSLIKNSVTGLWPGQEHPLDIPDFLRRKPK